MSVNDAFDFVWLSFLVFCLHTTSLMRLNVSEVLPRNIQFTEEAENASVRER